MSKRFAKRGLVRATPHSCSGPLRITGIYSDPVRYESTPALRDGSGLFEVSRCPNDGVSDGGGVGTG